MSKYCYFGVPRIPGDVSMPRDHQSGGSRRKMCHKYPMATTEMSQVKQIFHTGILGENHWSLLS